MQGTSGMALCIRNGNFVHLLWSLPQYIEPIQNPVSQDTENFDFQNFSRLLCISRILIGLKSPHQKLQQLQNLFIFSTLWTEYNILTV